MKKSLTKLLFASLITIFSSSKMVLSMETYKYENLEKITGIRIPTGFEVARVTLPFKDLVKKSVDNDAKQIEDKIKSGSEISE